MAQGLGGAPVTAGYCAIPPTNAHPTTSTGTPREVPGRALWGRGGGGGVDPCLSLTMQRPPCLSPTLQPARHPTPSLCQQGPCDSRVTWGRALGIPILFLAATCHLAHSHQPSPWSPQWGERLNIPPHLPLWPPSSSLYPPPRLVAAPPAEPSLGGTMGVPKPPMQMAPFVLLG